MSLVRIDEIISDRGNDILKKIYHSNISVLEKLSGISFYMKNQNNKKIFYRQDINNPINMIDRTLNKLWQEPLAYLDNISSLSLPENWTFKFEWFYNDNPRGLQYDRRPKNGLILTGVWDQKNNLVNDLSEVEEFNQQFNIEAVPILWDGTLTEEQITKIDQFIHTANEALETTYGTKSFIRYFLTVLNPNIKSCLQDSSTRPIEGVIIKFNESEVNDLVLIDQVFEDITKQIQINRAREPKTIYSLVLVDMMHWLIENKAINNIIIKGDTPDSRYVNTIITLWKNFIFENGSRYKELDFQLPIELKDDSFRINKFYINDPVALQLLDESIEYENLLQIFLAGFRKKKKKPIGLLTEDLLSDYNEIVDLLRSKIMNLYEAKFPSYSEFKKMFNSLEDDLTEEVEETTEEIPLENKPLKNEEIITDPVQPVEEPVVIEPVYVEPIIGILYNKDIPSKKLLDLITEITMTTNKKVVLLTHYNNQISLQLKEELFSEFCCGYSSMIIECVVADIPLNIFLKRNKINNIYIDNKDLPWADIIISSIVESLDTMLDIYASDLYDDQIEEAIVEKDFVKFKNHAPEIVVNSWLQIINDINPIYIQP